MLLALTAGIFDSIPIEHMSEAELAVRKSAEDISAELSKKLEATAKINKEDLDAIVEIARNSLSAFQSRLDSQVSTKAIPGEKS